MPSPFSPIAPAPLAREVLTAFPRFRRAATHAPHRNPVRDDIAACRFPRSAWRAAAAPSGCCGVQPRRHAVTNGAAGNCLAGRSRREALHFEIGIVRPEHIESARAAYAGPAGGEVSAFIADMAQSLAGQLVICRAGALTLPSCPLLCGLGAGPYPHAVDDHRPTTPLPFEAGAARLMADAALTRLLAQAARTCADRATCC